MPPTRSSAGAAPDRVSNGEPVVATSVSAPVSRGVPVRFRALDGWRGICALLVACYHLEALTHAYGWPLVRGAWLFVDFFFVLSGFVISHAYADRIATPAAFWRFLVRRFGRVWPLHAFILGLLVVNEAVKYAFAERFHLRFDYPPFGPLGPGSPAGILTNLFFVQTFGFSPLGGWNAPSWSVAVEFFAYAAFGLACLLVRRVLTHLSLVVAFLSCLMVFGFSDMGTSGEYAIFRCLYGFFCGVVTRRLWILATERGIAPPPWIEVVAVLAAMAFVACPKPNDALLLTPLVFGVVVWVFAFETGPCSRLLRWRPIDLLGLWSYSIYMVHWFVISVMRGAFKLVEHLIGQKLEIGVTPEGMPLAHPLLYLGDRWLTDALALAYLCAVVALASLTFRYVEEPTRRAFHRL